MPLLLTDRELADFRQRNASEFAEHTRVISAMRRSNIHQLRTERRPVGAADCSVRKHPGKDIGTLDNTAGDTEEHVPGNPPPLGMSSERGTSSMHTASGIPTELQVDGSNNEEGMRVGGLSGTNIKDPPKAGLHNAAHDAYKAAFDYVYGELAGMPDAGRCAALRAVLKAQGFSDADVGMILKQHMLAPIQAASHDRGTSTPAAQDTPPPTKKLSGHGTRHTLPGCAADEVQVGWLEIATWQQS